MKKLRIIAILFVCIFILINIVGCSLDELQFLDSLTKTASAKSIETKSHYLVTFNATNLTQSEKDLVKYIKPYLNNLELNLDQKHYQNDSNTISRSQIDANVNVGGLAFGSTLWSDSDFTNSNNNTKTIIKIPPFLSGVMPSYLVGKDYFIIKGDDVSKLQETSPINVDYKKSADFSKNILDKTVSFIKDYATNFKLGFDVVTRKDNVTIDGQTLYAYQLKLDDKSFKDLIKYTGNNFLQSDKALNYIKEMVYMYADYSLTPDEAAKMKSSFDTVFDGFKKEIPTDLENFNSFMDKYKDVKILGDKGILVDYLVNSEGFIVKEEGSINLSLSLKDFISASSSVEKAINGNLKVINKALAKSGTELDVLDTTGDITGTYNLGIDYSIENKNINKDIQIQLPETNSDNSLSLGEFIKYNTPAILDVDDVGTSSRKITGKADPEAKITVEDLFDTIGETNADKDGNFSINVDNLEKGDFLYITADNGYTKAYKYITVRDTTPPNVPGVNKVTIRSTHVTGKAEAYSTVYVKKGKAIIGHAQANSKGSYSIKISKQKAGTVLLVIAVDKDLNSSPPHRITVSK